MTSKVNKLERNNYLKNPRLLFIWKGFSLIELLIVISIIGVITSLGFANFRGSQRKKALESAARQVEGDLKKAYEYAISNYGELDICEDYPNEDKRFVDEVQLKITSESSYVLTLACIDRDHPDIWDTGDNLFVNIETREMPNDVTISSANCEENDPLITGDSYRHVDFNAIYDGAGVDVPCRITLTQVSTGDFIGIDISRTGEVTVNGVNE